MKQLALAGGCAMNSLANGRIFDRTDVEEVFIQAAAGDAGTSLGAALYVHHAVLGAPRSGFVMEHCYWGPRYGETEIRRAHRGRHSRARRARTAPAGEIRDRDRCADEDRSGRGDRRGDRRAARWSAGTRGARSGARARSATARSWPIRGART